MKPSPSFRPRIGLVVVLAGIAVLPGLYSSQGTLRSETRLEGRARLIAIDPLPGMDGAMCEWVPSSRAATAATVSTGGALTAPLQQQAVLGTAGNEARRAEVARRRPLRTIQDQYALFSAVAVDAARNEAVVTDENLFRVLVYDRTANTPPSAALTEPKRSIGGPATHLELNCGVYIDPKTGNIYAVNNDTEDHLVVFDRQAKGNTPPTWKLHTPHGAFGIAVDERKEELILTIQHSNAVVGFPKTARNDDPPSWLLQGDRTQLADPHGVALDSKTNLLFVSNFGSTATPRTDGGGYIQYNRTKFKPGSKAFWPLDPGQMLPGSGRTLPASTTVYEESARGDAAPIRVISGPRTQLNWPGGCSWIQDVASSTSPMTGAARYSCSALPHLATRRRSGC